MSISFNKNEQNMFYFGNANEAQRKAITSSNGPVLITAGPGTGKTYTLVQRTIYLIKEIGVKPENIFIATFTEKAAKELITRITNELTIRGISANINEMYVGTFHSLCLRIIKEHLEYTRLKKNYRMLDVFDQQYIVFQNINRFRTISGVDEVLPNGTWKQAGQICMFSNNLTEELIDFEQLKMDSNTDISAIGSILETYQNLLSEQNLIDFSGIQIEAYRLLQRHPEVLRELHDRIQYIMIDEYQDTNYIQEQIVFLLGSKHHNICVVGDDDQGLYRFRGATIRNILEFPSRFPDGECKVIALVTNYRSNSDIVDFYNEWMQTTDGARFRFRWKNFRFDKVIVPNIKSCLNSPAVVRLTSIDDANEWYEKILRFIRNLKENGNIQDYNQIAFLFNSVKHPRVTRLAHYLENHGINVYSPRSDMFFQRDEVKMMLGCLMLMFPKYVSGLEKREYQFLKLEHYKYYINCIELANIFLVKAENADFRNWIRHRGKIHFTLKETTDYGYSGLIYRMFEFSPFAEYLSSDLRAGVVDIRPIRNIALLTQIIGKYEYLHGISVLDATIYEKVGLRRVDYNTERLFNLYLRLLYDGGINEYEDDSEYAPSGCVSFLTIHQSKGMEFPIVVVDSLDNIPRKNYSDLIERIAEKYYKRPPFEPADQTKYFDFWRKYYTAFSRAQDLLVLTCNEDKRTPSMYFSELYNDLKDIEAQQFDISEFKFKTVKDVNLKESFSFTSHIAVYELCPTQYKFYKELGFAPVRAGAILFGMVVHQTIEDIHRAVLRHEEHLITVDNISGWFDANYTSLSRSEHTYLGEAQKRAALKQVQRYAERQAQTWSTVKEAEVDVSLVKSDYIIEGKIDLIRGTDDTVELVDFKSEKKPDVVKYADRVERYRRQLQVYAHLVEERTGQKVSKMHLYYTGEENGSPFISFPYQKSAVDATIQSFDDTVHKILKKDFSCQTKSTEVCQDCDFRFYCGR